LKVTSRTTKTTIAQPAADEDVRSPRSPPPPLPIFDDDRNAEEP
jgi:hypothetical protein